MLASSLLALASLLAPLAALRVNATPLAERGVNVGWPYGSEKIRGVNIGGVSGVHDACLSAVSVHGRVPLIDMHSGSSSNRSSL